MQRIVVVAIVLGLAVLAAPVPTSAQTMTVVSDTTWTVRAISKTGLPIALGPAEAVCLNAVAPPNCPPDAVLYGHVDTWFADLSSIPGAIWIWAPDIKGSTSPADLQTFWFSKVIDLPAEPLTGSISIAVDDYAEIMVNGQLVAAYGSVTQPGTAIHAHNSLRKYSVKYLLRKGDNQIVIRAQNGPSSFVGICNPCNYAGNPAGVVFGLNISY
jgi:hypothetical protein